jgi:hypothetical protein
MRAQPQEESSLSAAEAFFGSPLVLPGEFLSTPGPPAATYLENLWP